MKEYIEQGRSSGKTFRSLLKGLESASSGETVKYLTNHRHLSSWYFDRACGLVQSYTGMNRITVDKKERKITFPNGGNIQFCFYDKDKLAGLHYVPIEDN